ncbi:MAG: hypothetical protein KBG64_02085 [Clostridia bacterium]|nr:hypothetical protein [Clostridia bacterium]
MPEALIKLVLAVLAGFGIIAASLFIARKLSSVIDAKRHNDTEQDKTNQNNQ